MKETTKETALVFVPKLPDTPGWVALPYAKQQEIVEHTSRVQQFRRMQRLGEFGELVELTQVNQLLEGEELKMLDYLRVVYPDHNWRTLYRKQQAFQEVATHIPNSVLKKIAGVNEEVLGKFERITSAPLGEIQRVLREMPILPLTTDKAAEQYLLEVDNKLLEERQDRYKKGRIRFDDNQAAKAATNAVLHYMKKIKLKTSADNRQFLKRVFGYVMEARGVPGTLQVVRVPIPDGVIIRRGRPKGSKTRKEAA